MATKVEGLYGEWDEALQKLGDWRKNLPKALKTALLQEGEFARSAIVRGIDSGAPGGKAFRKLSPNTLMVRRIKAAGKLAGGRVPGKKMTRTSRAASMRRTGRAISKGMKRVGASKILVQSGTLRNSVTVVKKRGSVFVGVKRSAMSKGKNIYNIAKIHEHGVGPVAVRWTRKSRAWWFMTLKKAGLARGVHERSIGQGSVRILRIPPRPFIRPIYEYYYKRRRRDAVNRFGQRVYDLLESRSR